MYVMGQIDIMRRFLNAMNVTYVPLVATVSSTIMHLGWLLLFVTHLEMGINGLIISTTITFVIQLTVLLIYSTWWLPDLSEAIFLPSLDAFTGWSQYMKLSIPALLMLCSEWWAFEIITLMSGYLGVNEQAVIVVLFNLSELIFLLMAGFQ